MAITAQLIQSDIKTMSSREIAIMTDKQHSKVMRTIEDMIDRGVAKMATLSPYVNEQNGQSYNEYRLDKRDSLVLVARLSPEFTAAIVDRWQELESESQAMALPDFSNPSAAARAWAEQYDITIAAQEQLAIAAPKVEFHDTVVNSINTFSTRDAAKKINQRPIKFGEWLKSNGYMCLNGRAAQQYIDQGLFVTHTGVSDSKHSYTQTRMTGKGCAYFANKLFEIKL